MPHVPGMSTMSLSTQFLFFDPKRGTVRDRYAGFTLVKCTPYTPVQPTNQLPTYTMEIAPNQPMSRVIHIEKDNRWNMRAYPHSTVNFYSTYNNGSMCLNIRMYDLSDHFKANENVQMDNETFTHPMPVMFATNSIRDLFPPRAFKRNIRIEMTDSAATPETTHTGIILYMNGMLAQSLQQTTNQQQSQQTPPSVQPPPVQVPKPKSTKATPMQAKALCPFVAKKLLQLAIHTKENICPITLEELVMPTTNEPTGVAVMPCGHLFSELAITESFKSLVNRNTCPQCRTPGYPTIL